MSVVVNPANPPRDASFSYLTVVNSTVSGRPPRDALFSNLNVSTTDFSTGRPPKDISLSNLAVTGTVNGITASTVSIGHV